MKKSKKYSFLKELKNISFIFAICFVIPFLCFVFYNIIINKFFVFEEGYSVCGVDLSNLNGDQAELKLKQAQENTDNEIRLTLKYRQKQWVYDSKDFEVNSNIHIVLDELQKSYRKSSVDKARLIRKIKAMGFDNKIATNYVLISLDEKLEKIAQEIAVEPVSADARYNSNKNAFDIISAKYGTKLDKEKVYEEIVAKLKTSNDISIDISTLPVAPKYNEDDIIRATKKQSQFSTTYSNSSADRKNNIEQAVKSLNGYKIMPNEVFSFNNALGKRTTSNGYKEANIIKDGVFVKGVGGGICQVSTTLYNALLLADADVIEAHKHSLPVSYVPPCLDAMVSWGSSDLKFVNNTNLPMYIVAKANGEKIVFNIYGDTNKNNYKIKTKSVVLKTIPAGKDVVLKDKTGKYADKIMFKGEFLRVKKAKDGYEAKSFVEYYKDGKLVKSKQLRHATYDPQVGIVYEGCNELPEGMTLPNNNFIINQKTIVND